MTRVLIVETMLLSLSWNWGREKVKPTPPDSRQILEPSYGFFLKIDILRGTKKNLYYPLKLKLFLLLSRRVKKKYLSSSFNLG